MEAPHIVIEMDSNGIANISTNIGQPLSVTIIDYAGDPDDQFLVRVTDPQGIIRDASIGMGTVERESERVDALKKEISETVPAYKQTMDSIHAASMAKMN